MERCGLVNTVQMTKAVRNLDIMAYWVEYNVKLFVLGNRIVQKDRGDLKQAATKKRVSFSSAHTKESKTY